MEIDSMYYQRRLDMHLEICPVCSKGTLQFLIYEPETVVCQACLAELPRWMTKKERLEYMQEGEEVNADIQCESEG